MIDLGVHAVDLVRAVTGDDVTHVSAVLNGQAGDVETDAQLLVRMRAGAIGSIHASWSARPGPDHQLTVVGTEGTLHLDSRTPLTLVTASGERSRVELPDHDELAARRVPGRRERRARTHGHRGRRARRGCRGRGRVPLRGDRRAGRGAVMLDVGFGAAVITPPTPVQLAGFIEDQPATEVHDDLEVRAMYVRGELGAVCLLVCDLLGMSPSFARPVRESVAAALGLEVGAVLTSCVHTHAGPSTIAGSEALGWVTPEGYRELLVEQCTAAARAAAAAAVPASLRAGRFPLPAGLSINRRGLPYEPTFAVLDAIAPDGSRVGTLANVCDPPGGARAGVPGGVERLGRPLSHGAPGACGRVDGAAVRRARRRQPASRPPPAQRLSRRWVRRGRPARPRRGRGDRRGAARRGARRDGGPDGREGAHARRDHGRDAAHVRSGGAPGVDRAGRVGDRSGAPRVGARRGVPRPWPCHRAPRTARARCRPGARVARLPARCRSRTATRSR